MAVTIEGVLELIFTSGGDVISASVQVDMPSPNDEPLVLTPTLDVNVDTALQTYLTATYGLTGFTVVGPPRPNAQKEWTVTRPGGGTAGLVLWNATPLRQLGIDWGQTAAGNAQLPQGAGYLSLSMGHNTVANGERATALGADATAIANNAVAIGVDAKATAADSVAVGSSARATMIDSVALGKGADAGAEYSIVLGKQASATAAATSSVALGWGAAVRAHAAIAVGNAAIVGAGAAGAVAIGWVTDAGGPNAVAFGPIVKAMGNASIAVGYLASAEGADSIAIGRDATTLPSEAKHIDLAGRVLRMAVRSHTGDVLPGFPGVLQLADTAGALHTIGATPAGLTYDSKTIYPPDAASNAANATITVSSASPPEGTPITAAAATVTGLTPGTVRKVVGNVSIRMAGAPSTAGQWGFQIMTSDIITFVGVRSTDVPTQLGIYDFTYSAERTVGANGTISVIPAIKWGVGTFNVSWASATITVL